MNKAKLPAHDFDLIIIGGGPAGYTAGIYAARAGLKTLLTEGAATVSQIIITDLIENYPGIPDGINGFDLMQLFKNQALKFGLEVMTKDVAALKKTGPDDIVWEVTTSDNKLRCLAVIAATGAEWRKLGIPGEEEFAGRGVSYCATCDGPFYRDKDVVVIGGGDTAIQEALFLTHFARKVTVVHRRDRLRAADILQKRAAAQKKIEFVWKAKLAEIVGKETVRAVKLKDVDSGKISELPADGVFVFVGRIPQTKLFEGVVKLDAGGYVVTDDNMQTSAAGIFAAGDCRAKQFRQVITAAGDGANAIYSAELYIAALKGESY